MSVQVLLTGRLFRDPEVRAASSGKPFTRATVIAHDGDGDSFVSVIAFGEQSDVLAQLRKGDTASIAGRGRVATWEKAGETKAGLSVVAEAVMTLYQLRARRQAVQQAGEQSPNPGAAAPNHR